MTSQKALKANIPPFGLRMQPELKSLVEEAAAGNNRSMNAEIVARLEASFASVALPGSLGVADLAGLLVAVDQVHQAVKKLIDDEARNEEFRRAKLYEGMAGLLSSARKIKGAVWAADYDANPALRSEFLSRDNYAAYMLYYGDPDAFGVEWTKRAVAVAMESMRDSHNRPRPASAEPKQE